MDVEEQSIVEEYGSSLEDLTFNSKPLINVLTMLAEENSKYAKSVTKLIEERIYKVSQQFKLPSLYLLDSIIKNVGGTYLSLIAQVLVKVFVAVFEKADEKTRKDLYKLRHTWPQYFSAKILHDVDVNINKIDPGWPITAVPPPSPSIHVNPKFLKKAEVTAPQTPVVLPDASKNEEKQLLVEHQKRLAQLQRLQDEQLRLTEQEIQEHQLKRDLILKKQEQERKALLTQQQQLILALRLESELGKTESNEESSHSIVSTIAETTPVTHSVTSNRDPRLARHEQTPSHDNNNKAQNSRLMNNTEINHSADPRQKKQPSLQKSDRNSERNRNLTVPNNNPNRRSRSQSPLDDRAKKIHQQDHSKNKDLRSELEKHPREDRKPKRRRSLDGNEGVGHSRIVEFDKEKQGPMEGRGFRGRGSNNRGRDRSGRMNREERGVENRGQRGRGKVIRPRGGHQNSRDNEVRDVPGKTRPKLDDNFSKTHHPVVKPKPLQSNQDTTMLAHDATQVYSDLDQENATIPQELTLEHKSVILEEAKRRLEAGLISQDQYIELIDKLAEFYELQRQQEIETVQELPDGKIPFEQDIMGHSEGPVRGKGGRRFPRKRRLNESARHPRRDGPPRKEPRMEEPWRRDHQTPRMDRPGPPRPNRIVRMEEPRRDGPPQPMDGPGRPPHIDRPMLLPDDRPGVPLRDRPVPPEMERLGRPQVDRPPMDRPGPPEMDRLGRPPMDRPGPPEMDRQGLGPLDRPGLGPLDRPGPPMMDRPGPPERDRPGNGPWRGEKHERPPHDFGPANQHHVFRDGHPQDEGHPSQFMPPHIDERDFRGPNFHEGPPHRGEHHPVPFGHGRPVERIAPGHPGHLGPQGPPGGHGIHPMGPSHEPLPHDRPPLPGHTVEPGQHIMHPGRPLHPADQPQGPPHGAPHIQHLQIPGSPQRPGTNTPPPPMAMPSTTPPTPSRVDKRTVDDLFSRLVQVGIIKVAEEPVVHTPPRIGTPPTMLQPLHPNPIPPHPVSSSSSVPPSAPQISSQPQPMAPISFQKLQEMIKASREASTKIPQIELHVDDLKKRYSGIINMLYEGQQCSSCGLRFAGEAAAFYREHLDWHFRRNRREKDGRRIAHKQWYIPLKDWLEYEEITDPEEKAHSSFFDSAKPEVEISTVKSSQESDGSCPVLSTDSEAEAVCDICQEKFEQFWEETQEEWHYKEAIRVGGKTYHDVCYQDAKSNVEEATTEAEANVGNQEEPSTDVSAIKKEEEHEVKDTKKEEQEDQDSKKEEKITETEATVVANEDIKPVVKTEPKVDDQQCSESAKMKEESVIIPTEVKVKTEVMETTESEINIKEENKDSSEDTNMTNKNNTISTEDK